jgi:hypothetical protein
VDDVLSQAGVVAGKVILTCSLPMSDADTELVVAHTSSGAEELAKKTTTRRRRLRRGWFVTLGFEPTDVGALASARYIEPFTMLIAKLAYEGDGGPELAYRFERFEP